MLHIIRFLPVPVNVFSHFFLRKLPVGVQDFEKLREGDFLYVDKTKYIYKLVQNGAPYFLSRPRRFGKSLLLSTLRCHWEGRRELFDGLAIEELSKDEPVAFEPHPVLYFDLNRDNYQAGNWSLIGFLPAHLRFWQRG